jgi:exoribonuclease R
MCAAKLMLDAGYGILRTVASPEPGAIDSLKRAARALGVDWPDGAAPGDVLSKLDRTNGKHVAFIEHAVALLRGAGYTTFDKTPPEQPLHAGIAAPYAHVTAPLRRLVDRYGSEVCLAAHAKQPIPQWVLDRMPQLPEEMADADRRAHEVDRAVVDMTEAWLLSSRVGQDFAATVIDAERNSGTIVVDDPAVRARCDGANLPVGQQVTVRLLEADVQKRSVRFQLA